MTNYLSNYSDLIKEWHPTKNGALKPDDLTFGSGRKVWWRCSKNQEHEWEAVVVSRTKSKTSCPYCSGKKVSRDNNLKFIYPEIAKEWHPTKNGELKPEDVTHGSRKRVWWQCLKYKEHEWQSPINRAKKNSGCPFCSGQKPSSSNNLMFLFPEIAKEWHPTKNGELKPSDVTAKTRKKVYWFCSKGHTFISSIAERTRVDAKRVKCPYCSGKKVGPDNNLKFINPKIANEWHPTKNFNLKPQNFTFGSSKKVYWLCPKGHTYYAAIKERTREKYTSCPFCTFQTSKPEIRILTECMYIFKNVISRHKIENYEVDIFISDVNVAIEYDGSYYHKDSYQIDLKKNEFLKSRNINLIRVRHFPLERISSNDIIIRNETLKKSDLNTVFKTLQKFGNENYYAKFTHYFSERSFINEKIFRTYLDFFPSPFPEKSLLKTHPKISKEWDYKANFPLKPDNFTYGSSHEALWICKKGHSYSTLIKNRTGNKKADCPYCSGQKVGEDNNLKFMYPDIAREWHPTKNGNMRPEDFTYKSGANVYWLCSNGHEYKSTIARRSRTDRKKFPGCPHCKKFKMQKKE